MASTLGYFHGGADSAQAVAAVSMSIVDAVADLAPKGYVSIKAPACDYDPKLIASIVLRARDKGVLAHFDSHQHHTSEATLECVRQVAGLGAEVGLTVPGRWRRSLADAEMACGLGVRVRVVKGERADPGDPGRDARRGFLEVVECLAALCPEQGRREPAHSLVGCRGRNPGALPQAQTLRRIRSGGDRRAAGGAACLATGVPSPAIDHCSRDPA
jgi:hypothetical protein